MLRARRAWRAAAVALAHFREASASREADRALRDAPHHVRGAALDRDPGRRQSVRAARCRNRRGEVQDGGRAPSTASSGATRLAAAGLRAQYYAALSPLELGQYAEAEKALKAIQARGAGLEPALARLALADVDRRSGRSTRRSRRIRAIADDPSASLPRDHALMSAARTLEDARRFAEARAAYRRLAEEFPASVYAAEARARADYLATAG